MNHSSPAMLSRFVARTADGYGPFRFTIFAGGHNWARSGRRILAPWGRPGDGRNCFGHKLTGVCLHCDSLGGLQMRWVHLIALVIGIMAILGVFIEIPFVSEYAFWVMTVAF